MDDNYQFQGQRRQLVSLLRENGINNEDVLKAIGMVPRQFFFDSAFALYAYIDKPFSIGNGQTISQPSTVAFQTQLLDVSERQKVLEIGTGSGYQAAVLDRMGARVFTVERFKELYLKAKSLLSICYPKIKCFFGDGYNGLASFAPFDRILVTAAAPNIPVELFNQLKVGGKMVIPIGSNDENQEMILLTKTSENDYDTTTHGNFKFVPMLENTVSN